MQFAYESSVAPPRKDTSPQLPPLYNKIKLTAKTVDEDPASCKRWISRKEIKSAKI